MNTKKRLLLLLFMSTVLAAILRLWKIDVVPVSLFGDELDVGYQAYSMLKTGRDYSGNFLPFQFHSLAEWRTPLYLYSAVPTVALFGISALGVRLPAAIFGIITVPILYWLVSELMPERKYRYLPLLSSFLLAISPWHIQYSRAAFEVTELLFFLLSGISIFFYGRRSNGRYLWLSSLAFALTPWIYSTAKVFTPLILLSLLIIYRKDIVTFSKKSLILSVVVFILLGVPLAWSTFFSEGTQRFSFISIFSDPTMETQIGAARQSDVISERYSSSILPQPIADRIFHNKATFFGDIFLRNALMPFSTDFLFSWGDPNPRHTIEGMGVLYKIEFLALLGGVGALFFSRKHAKRTIFILCWFAFGILPSSLTIGGGYHATRLIVILPALIILIGLGWLHIVELTAKKYRILLIGLFTLIMAISFLNYQHTYWSHNPIQSERWWHYGWKEAVQSALAYSDDYDRVIISTADEPPWIFFAAWSSFDPVQWQAEYPFKQQNLPSFGVVSYIDKYYFGSPLNKKGLYEWGRILDPKTLYVATAKEVNVNLVAEPSRLPNDLQLVQSIVYPSGEPAFYLLTGVEK